MTILFKAKSREGYVLKILAELLQNNFKTACFEIDKSGLKLRMMDTTATTLIDLELDANNFSPYKFTSEERLFIGINLTHFHKMLKTIKKRDSIEFFITEESPTELGIKVIPKENNRVTTSCIKIQTIQNLDIDLPEGYGRPVLVPSSEFQKMSKGLTHISKMTHITSKGFIIRFSSNADEVMKRYTEFGEDEDSESEVEDLDDSNADYSEDFDTEQLTKITKLAGLGTNIQIYPSTGNPLLFKTNVGNLGKISVFIKSKSQQEKESHSIEREED